MKDRLETLQSSAVEGLSSDEVGGQLRVRVKVLVAADLELGSRIFGQESAPDEERGGALNQDVEFISIVALVEDDLTGLVLLDTDLP